MVSGDRFSYTCVLKCRSFCQKCVVCQDRWSIMAVISHDRFHCRNDTVGTLIKSMCALKEYTVFFIRHRLNYSYYILFFHLPQVANLSYQELGHSYQMEQFLKVLARLKNTRKLNLQEDRLTNLHSLTFPQ